MTLGMARAVEKGEAAIVAGDVAMVRDVAVVVAPHPRVPLMRYYNYGQAYTKNAELTR